MVITPYQGINDDFLEHRFARCINLFFEGKREESFDVFQQMDKKTHATFFVCLGIAMQMNSEKMTGMSAGEANELFKYYLDKI